jgi:hypothetical protein
MTSRRRIGGVILDQLDREHPALRVDVWEADKADSRDVAPNGPSAGVGRGRKARGSPDIPAAGVTRGAEGGPDRYDGRHTRANHLIPKRATCRSTKGQ